MNIFITGTSRGIGNYLAQYYLSKGHKVFGCSRTIASIQNINYYHFLADITLEEDVLKIYNQLIVSGLGIDILINNAGIAAMNFSILTPISQVTKIFETNFLGTFIFSKVLFKLLKKSINPRIINFTTVAVPLNLEGESIYSSSKAAVEQLTKVMAKEFYPFGITVNAIGPSPIKTDLIKHVSEEKLLSLLDKMTIKSFGNFDDLSNVIDFFIQPKSKSITGQVIYLGGLTK
jgi:3-oxoacyl-[acyl-carrier protein] reductase